MSSPEEISEKARRWYSILSEYGIEDLRYILTKKEEYQNEVFHLAPESEYLIVLFKKKKESS